MASRTFRKKKQPSRVFFGVIFDVYTHVDNRERVRASDWKKKADEFCRKKNMNIQSGCETMRMLAATKVKMSGSEK